MRMMAFALAAIVMICAGSASADNLPSSIHPSIGKPWKVMNTDTFDGTPAQAREACLVAARHDVNDTLTLEMCALFAHMLKEQLCDSVMVPNGVVFDYMLFRRENDGTTHVQSRLLKALEDGREHTAKLCDLGDGVWGYLFDGDRGCNNPAFVMLPPPSAPQSRWVCERQTFGQDHAAHRDLHLPGFLAQSCNCGRMRYYPGITLEQGGNSLRSHGYTNRCAWQPSN